MAALEHGTSAYPEQMGAFPQVAGITYAIDLSREAGSRVTDVIVGGEPVEAEKMYKLATNDFLAVGGDEYTMFKDSNMLGEFSALNEILESYIQELGVVNVQTEGRITIKEEPESEPEPAEETQPVPVEPEEDAKEQVAAASQDVYVVKPNDVLWKIAQRFGLTWQRLAEYNSLANPHLIFPGQEILIPAN